MRKRIDFDEIQKAMEDIDREAFDYFFDSNTGDVLIISTDILAKAEEMLSENWDDDMPDFEAVEFDEELDIPQWMEDEVELALTIFMNDDNRYIRIPERRSDYVFDLMKGYTSQIEKEDLRQELLSILEGRGSFRRFKDALEPFPKERKLWYGYNAKMARNEIMKWLDSIKDPAGSEADELEEE
jgi:hypothetical protein